MESMLKSRAVLLGAVLIGLAAPQQSPGQVLFSDNFDADTSANWNLFEASGNGTPDYTAQFGFDYSATAYTANGVTGTIPPAPSSDGTTRGLKLTVNKDGTGSPAAVSLYPNGQSFTGNYALRFDLWLNYNGPAYGGSGSTEHALFGINHVGDKVNWDNATALSDGIWFSVSGEGGAGISTISDYNGYAGDGVTARVRFDATSAGMLDRDQDGNPEREVNPNQPAGYPLKLMFPSPTFESAGAPGKRWVQVEVRQQLDEFGTPWVTWLMDGYVIAEHDQGSVFGQLQGNVMIGLMDYFSSIANPAEDNFAIFDNVRVVNLDGEASNPVVSIASSDFMAVESGGDLAEFTLSRTGDLSSALTVGLRVSGTAEAGVDYEALPVSVTIPAGADSVSVTLTPLDDASGEADETIFVTLEGSQEYEVREGLFVQIDLGDDGDVPTATLEVIRPVAYELNASGSAKVQVRLSTPSFQDTFVAFTTGGTAVSGTDYASLANSVVILAGETTGAIEIVPINNFVVDGDRTVTVTLAAGDGYTLGTDVEGSVTIRNDDREEGTELFAEDFDTNVSANWVVNQGPSDGLADFFFDYSLAGIPPAPRSSGTTRGLLLQANLSSAVFGGLSVSPADQNFTGNYRLEFDMWLNYNGPLNGGGSGSTQVTGAGIGTAGLTPQWPGGVQDSVWFGVTGDGGSGVDFRAYSSAASTGYTDGSGVFAAGTGAGVRNNTHPYYAQFGNEEAPIGQQFYPSQTGATLVGSVGFQWRDVAITKIGNQITWEIDGLKIATVDASEVALGGGNILFNHFDINASVSADFDAQDLLFGLIDNVRVVALEAQAELPVVSITATDAAAGEAEGDAGIVVISRTGDTSSALTVGLQAGGTAVGGVDYTVLPSVVIIGAGEAEASLEIQPIDNSTVDGDRSVVVTLLPGAEYTVSASGGATVIISDDDELPQGTVLFEEDFGAGASANWTVNQGPSDGVADFAFDYSTVGIPPAPNSTDGSTIGLKLQANVSSGVFGGLSVSPTGQSFSGDYRLRLDMWLNYNGPVNGGGAGSTQVTGAGIGTAGTSPQWAGGTQDSVWFGTTGDGGSTVDYRAYSSAANSGYTDASGVFAAGTTTGVRNSNHEYYSAFGGVPAPTSQLDLFAGQTGLTAAGAQGFQWRDVVIQKIGNEISWSIDGQLIATVDASTVTLGGGNILLNHFDINGSASSDLNASLLLFGLIDNVRVEAIPSGGATPQITSIQVIDSNVQIDFTASPADAPENFVLESSADVNVGYADVTTATITQVSPGQFRAVASLDGAQQFYRIQR